MKVNSDVLNVLSASVFNGNSLLLTGQLDRSMYVQVNKVLEAAGGKWNKSAKAHIFDKDAETRIDEIILTGEVDIPKDEFNYFPTPPTVVAELLHIANIKEGMNVLEPSAGQGAIAKAVIEKGAFVYCYELMEKNFEILKEQLDKECLVKADFLTIEPDPRFDRVVMNPPFAKQQDIKHVLHALKFLKDDGLLVSVMASSVTFRDNSLTTEFRGLIKSRGGFIEALPEGSFKESGTMVNTVIVVIPS